MMRAITAGLGLLTVVAAAATLTPPGQSMLGIRPASSPRTFFVIPDTESASGIRVRENPIGPELRPSSLKTRIPSQGRVIGPRIATPALPSRPVRPRSTVAPRLDRRAPVALVKPPAVKVSTDSSSVVDVARLLITLPEVLSQTEVRPVPAPEGPRAGGERRGHIKSSKAPLGIPDDRQDGER